MKAQIRWPTYDTVKSKNTFKASNAQQWLLKARVNFDKSRACGKRNPLRSLRLARWPPLPFWPAQNNLTDMDTLPAATRTTCQWLRTGDAIFPAMLASHVCQIARIRQEIIFPT
jgi:hypothetical protein